MKKTELMYPAYGLWHIWCVIAMLAVCASAQDDITVDPNGYLFSCLCMGNLGNQAELLLGVISFAIKLNRTVILPPIRRYHFNVPFDDWFGIHEDFRQVHRFILAKDFMDSVAERIWPPKERVGFCFQIPSLEPCELKSGYPHNTFWDTLGIEFPRTERHNLGFRSAPEWRERYTPDKFPVIATKDAPAKFPVAQEDVHLQKYVIFSQKLEHEADDLIRTHFGDQPYVGIHLRNGGDWDKACDTYVDGTRKELMASYQCTGFDFAIPLTYDMCLPSKATILRHTKRVVEQYKLKNVLVATDKFPMVSDLEAALPGVKVVHVDPELPVMDLVLLTKSKVFIGNCVSSFSSFVWRHRLHHDLGKTEHFGLEYE